MNAFDRHAAAMTAVRSRTGQDGVSITWGQDDYPIIPGSAVRRADLSAGGFQLNADFRFNALSAPFFSADIQDVSTLKDRMLQTTVVYLGDSYKVIDFHILPGELQFMAECNSLNQRA